MQMIFVGYTSEHVARVTGFLPAGIRRRAQIRGIKVRE